MRNLGAAALVAALIVIPSVVAEAQSRRPLSTRAERRAESDRGDRIEDIRDRREDRADRREGVRDRRENVRDRREDRRDRRAP